MVKIASKTNTLPVEIGELHYEVRITDEMLLKMEKAQVTLSEKYKEVRNHEGTSLEKVVESLNDSLEKMFDAILGEGAYKDLYKQTPSAFELFHILQQLVEAITQEAEKLRQKKQENIQKYTG